MNFNFKFDPGVDVNEVGTISVLIVKKGGRIVPQVCIEPQAADRCEKPVRTKEANFRHLVQHPEPERLMQRLHKLIDGSGGADVGCVLLRCVQENYLLRNPTRAEFCAEFRLVGSWQSIHNYMDGESEKALLRANKVVIF